MNANTTKDIFNNNVKSKNSYMCNTLTKYDMSSNSSNVTLLQISFENFQAQAFDFDKANEFGSGKKAMHSKLHEFLRLIVQFLFS